jgi:glycosyltransferase involved in cell wall biosynthesis
VRHGLFVVFHYPPEASSSGVLRTLKYTRYLGGHGWRITVLTVERNAYQVQDPELERQIPPDVRVVRTRFVNVKRHLAIWGRYPGLLAVPDPWIGWWPWAVRAGRRVMRADPVDLVYSTSPHATAHLVALSLVRRTGLPWVTDFRDPWYEEPPEPGTSRIVHGAARRLERLVIRRSDRVVVTTERMRDTLAARYSDESRAKFAVIANGYDEDDFGVLAPVSKPGPEELLIVHAGSLNPGFRDPRPLFAAIKEAADTGTLDISKIRLRFFGGGAFGESTEVQRALVTAGLSERVEFQPRVTYGQILEELLKADLLLLLQNSPDTQELVPAKLFEYLRAGRPVLAVAGPGATAEVLRDVGGGWAADPSVRTELRHAVTAAYRAWRAGTLGGMTANPAALRRFSRAELTGQLARQLNSLVSGSRS